VQERGPSHSDLELVYSGYPRKVAKGSALKAIRAAVVRLGSGTDLPVMSAPEALECLQKRVQAFARSPAGRAGEYTPHPATWFNAARYLDDEQEWQGGRNGSTSDNRQAQRVSPAVQRGENSRA